jgi:hypothetical protein
MGSVLDVVIGLAVVFLLFSVLCSAIQESIAWALDLRARTLQAGIVALLDHPDAKTLAHDLFDHGIMKGLAACAVPPAGGSGRLQVPSYVPAHLFVSALLGVLRGKAGAPALPAENPWTTLRARVAAVEASVDPVRSALLALLDGDGAETTRHALDLAARLGAPEVAAARDAVRAALEGMPPSDAWKALVAFLEADKAQARAAALDLGYQVLRARGASSALAELRAALAQDAWAKEALLPQLDASVADVAEARARLERWFDDAMQRVSGVYKRKSQLVIGLVALGLCFACNVDSLQIARTLINDAPQRAALVAVAERLAPLPAETPETPRPPDIGHAAETLAKTKGEIEGLSLPIGWHAGAHPPWKLEAWLAWVGKLLGLLCSVIAISLGAPFWFETLNKFVNIRAAGKPPASTAGTARPQ